MGKTLIRFSNIMRYINFRPQSRWTNLFLHVCTVLPKNLLLRQLHGAQEASYCPMYVLRDSNIMENKSISGPNPNLACSTLV